MMGQILEKLVERGYKTIIMGVGGSATNDGGIGLLVPLGFAAYCYINWRVAGNPFQFLIYQREHWNQRTGLFFSTAAYQTDYFLRSLTTGGWRDALGLWLPNLIACFAALGLLAAAAPKLRASQTAWFLAYYIVAVGATWLLSVTVLRGRPSAPER